MKILGRLVIVAVIVFGILIGIGFNMTSSGEEYLIENGYSKPIYFGKDKNAKCSGKGVGMVFSVNGVQAKTICIDIFGEVKETQEEL